MSSQRLKLINIPNLISSGRLLLIPAILMLMVQQSRLPSAIAAFLFFLAGLSDFLDGLVARKRKSITSLGILLDGLGDKILVISVLVTLMTLDVSPPWFVVFVMILLSREIAVAALLGLLVSQNVTFKPTKTIKIKIVLQFLAFFSLIFQYPYWGINFFTVGLILLIFATIFSLISAIEYCLVFAKSYAHLTNH